MQSPNELNPDPSHRAIEARLRALPDPPVPASLEGRLLAAIPTEVTTSRVADRAFAKQGWLAVASTVAALAAVALVAVFSWQGGSEKYVTSVAAPTADDLLGIVMSPVDRRILQGAGDSTFRWPVHESPPVKALSPIPRDLLD
jgi:hypothetical protein